jgi:hypothetical protein
MDNEPQYTIVRENGQMFHTDQDTIALLQAAQRYDQGETRPMEWDERSVSELVFERGLANGRIGEGSVIALEHGRQEPQQTPGTQTEAAASQTPTHADEQRVAMDL